MPRPIRPAPTAAKRGSVAPSAPSLRVLASPRGGCSPPWGGPASDCSFPIVQPLLELRRRQAGEAERFERARTLAQIAAEEATDDGQQAVRDRRVDTDEAR